jgi:hypothetical protein
MRDIEEINMVVPRQRPHWARTSKVMALGFDGRCGVLRFMQDVRRRNVWRMNTRDWLCLPVAPKLA